MPDPGPALNLWASVLASVATWSVPAVSLVFWLANIYFKLDKQGQDLRQLDSKLEQLEGKLEVKLEQLEVKLEAKLDKQGQDLSNQIAQIDRKLSSRQAWQGFTLAGMAALLASPGLVKVGQFLGIFRD